MSDQPKPQQSTRRRRGYFNLLPGHKEFLVNRIEDYERARSNRVTKQWIEHVTHEYFQKFGAEGTVRDEDGGDERSRSQYKRDCPVKRQSAMVRRADNEGAYWIMKGVFSVASLLDHNRPTQPMTSPKAATSMVGTANHRR